MTDKMIGPDFENGGSSKFKELNLLALTAGASFVTTSMNYFNPGVANWPLSGVSTSYFYNSWLINGIDSYDVFIRFHKKEIIKGFIYTGWAQYANMTIKTCEVYAITDPANLDEIELFGSQADVTGLTKVFDNNSGLNEEFPEAVTSDLWNFANNDALKNELLEQVECYGLVFRPKKNHGHATRTAFFKLLFY